MGFHRHLLFRINFALILIVLLLIAGGCAVTPAPVAPDDVAARAAQDLAEIRAQDRNPEHPLTLAEAIARAVKYNLDNKLKLMEVVVADSRLSLSHFDMLPRLAMEAGYNQRTNRHASESRSILTNRQSLEPSTSQDEGISLADLETSWNVLDFGINYLSARQGGNQLLITIERQRKIVQNIVKDVRYAYFRMRSAQRLKNELQPLLADVQEALRNSEEISRRGLQPKAEQLQYQRELLELKRQMVRLQRDLEEGRIELVALLGLAPESKLVLADDDSGLSPDHLAALLADVPMDTLREYAVRSRPELIEEDYRTRIAVDEIKKTRLRALPGLEGFAGLHYNENDFLVNQGWGLYGVRLTWNLMRAISTPRAVKYVKDEKRLADIRRLALSMAVMTQVDVAALRYLSAGENHALHEALGVVDDALAEQSRMQASSGTNAGLTALQRRAQALVTGLQRDTSLAAYHDAAGELLASLGYAPVPVFDYSAPVSDLTREIDRYLKDTAAINLGRFYVGYDREALRERTDDPFLRLRPGHQTVTP